MGEKQPHNEDAANGTSGRQHDQSDEALDPQRFPPRDRAAGTTPTAAFVPGVVEVELRDGLQVEIVTTGDASPTVESRSRADVSGLNEVLQRHALTAAEPSIVISEQEASTARAMAQQQGIDVPSLANFVTLHFPPGADTQQIAQELNAVPEVIRAVPVPEARPPQSPLNEPLVGTGDQVVVDPLSGYENQWYIYRCRANHAWSRASGDGVVIVDIDWGYRVTHEDLASRLDLANAFNSFDGGTNVSTGGSVSHGTAVMGITGGADNDRGVAGFAYGASLWPVQADSGPGTPLGGNPWARAIEWVRARDSNDRRKVIILEVQTGSFGNYEMVPSVNAAIRTAIAFGVVVCVAAGNGDRDAGIDDQGNPIPETGSILVGATAYHASQNPRAWFSNYGPRIVVSAPGDPSHDLTCNSTADAEYRNGFGGTSGATPKVAGVAALMLEVNPNLTHQQVRDILRSTGSAVNTTPDKPIGTFLNAEAAVRAAGATTVRPEPDLNGDRRADILGFGDAGVWVAINQSNGAFQAPQRVVDNFAYNAGGWRVERHPRLLADLTGDGRADIVGFGDAGVWVSLNNGDGTFGRPNKVIDNFAYSAGGWRVERHPRFLADLTGDGRADIVGFGDAGVWVALNNGDGTFQAPNKVVDNFGYSAGGWRVDKHPRFLADLTGDGTADIVGFGDEGVWVAFNQGNGTFLPPTMVLANFAYNAGGWRVDKHPRFLADVTGNGCADVMGFGDDGVWVASNNRNGTFDPPQLVLNNFGYNAGGWRVQKHPRFMSDLTGDGRADVIGFGDDGVWVALNNGAGSFQAPQLVVNNFAYNAGGWRVEKHPRVVADLTGDCRTDIVGFGDGGVWIALNNGNGTFQTPQLVVGNFGYTAGGWRIEKHPRFLAGHS